MKQQAKTSLTVLAVVGIISAGLSALLTLFGLAAQGAPAQLASAAVPVLWPVAVVFIAVWLLARAVVAQLANDDS